MTCRETGKPIEGARVFLRPDPISKPEVWQAHPEKSGEVSFVRLAGPSMEPKAQETLTDAQGSFRFSAPAGPSTLWAAAKGFCAMLPGLKVEAGEARPQELALARGLGLIFRIRGSSGEEVRQVAAQLRSPRGLWMCALSSKDAFSKPLPDGSLEVGGIDPETNPPDQTTLVLWASGYLPREIPLASLPVSEGRYLVDAFLEPGRTVRGILLGSDGLPVPGKAGILAWPEGSSVSSGPRLSTAEGCILAPGVQEVPVSTDGTFLLQGLPTDKALHLWAQGELQAMNEPKILEPGQGETCVTFRCDAAGEISGRVLDPDGRPVPGASVSISVGDGKNWSFAQRTSTDPEGRYRLKGLPRGKGLHLEAWKAGFNNVAWQEVPLGIENADFVLVPGKKGMVVKAWPKP